MSFRDELAVKWKLFWRARERRKEDRRRASKAARDVRQDRRNIEMWRREYENR